MGTDRSSSERVRVAMPLEQCWHQVPGGTASSAVGLSRSLDALPDVEVIGVAARHSSDPDPAWRPDVPVRHMSLPRGLLYQTWNRLGRPSIDPVVGEVDVVHATGMVVPGTAAPLVVTVHDLAFEEYPDHPTRVGLSFMRASIAAARARAAAVVCPSEATASVCRAAGFDPSLLHVIPWGVDWPVASDEEVRSVRARFALPGRFVFWSGTLEPRKNLPKLLEAGLELEDGVSLVLAGPEGWHEDVDVLAKRLGPRLRRLGMVSIDELRALHRAAAVTAYPSLLEGFGLPVLEAMSQATPVVTSAGSAMAEVLGGGGRLVDPSDPAALAKALTEILDDDDLADRLGAAGLSRSLEYSWERCARRHVDVYRAVLGS